MIALLAGLGAFGVLAYYGYRRIEIPEDPPAIDTPVVPLTNDGVAITMIDPQDRGTWPNGDKVWDFCQAIAIAEGYNEPGSNPSRLCNPGDISDYAHVYGSEHHSGSNVTHFPDQATGWQRLYEKVHNALTGESHVFLPTMTFLQFAQKYAGDWQNWIRNFSNDLGVNSSDVIGTWYNS